MAKLKVGDKLTPENKSKLRDGTVLRPAAGLDDDDYLIKFGNRITSVNDGLVQITDLDEFYVSRNEQFQHIVIYVPEKSA